MVLWEKMWRVYAEYAVKKLLFDLGIYNAEGDPNTLLLFCLPGDSISYCLAKNGIHSSKWNST